MALKRVCDITGTDRDVEICDVTIAGQTVKLDLSPAGAEKLREFFGPVVVVRHPSQGAASDTNASAHDGSSAAAYQGSRASADAGAEEEVAEEEDENEQETAEDDEISDAADETGSAAAQRPARRGRRAAASAKTAPKKKQRQKKPVARRVAASVTPGTSEIREWARANGFEIGERGAIPGRIRSAYTLAHE